MCDEESKELYYQSPINAMKMVTNNSAPPWWQRGTKKQTRLRNAVMLLERRHLSTSPDGPKTPCDVTHTSGKLLFIFFSLSPCILG